MLTTAIISAARPQARAYKIADSAGLYLHVAPSGRRTFRQKFRRGGREQLAVLGAWPEISLFEARSRAIAARAGKSAEQNANSFEAVARRWHEERRVRWSDVHAADVIASLKKHLFAELGAMPIGEIEPTHLLEQLERIAARAPETATRILQRQAAIFDYAITRKLCASNPAATIRREIVRGDVATPHAAVTDIADARRLYAEIAAQPETPARLAGQFLALTAVRSGALRGARWDEIVIGPDGMEWHIPAARMKLAKAKKGSDRYDHVVPISPAAAAVLEQARHFATPVGLIFGSMGERALLRSIERTSFAGRHVPHGWRAAFSTIMNHDMPAERLAIDLALGHAGKGKVEGAYNRADHLERRRAVLDRWAQLLTDGQH